MKIRNGFVSNSSASSFIVRNIEKFLGQKAKTCLTKKQINKLIAFGFKETHLSHPSHLDNTKYDDQSIWQPMMDEKTKEVVVSNYGYWVSCNEWDVIQFLVKNNIGFIATGHYGHITYLFHSGDKHLMIFRNYGAEVETYYHDKSWEEITKQWKLYNSGRDEEPYSRMSIKEVLKG